MDVVVVVQGECYLHWASLPLIALVSLVEDRVWMVVRVLVAPVLLFYCLFCALSFLVVLVAAHVRALVEHVLLHLQLLVLDDGDDVLFVALLAVVLATYFAPVALGSSFVMYFLRALV